MIRLFVGLALPEPLRAELARRQNGVPGARWVEPKNLHITLRFIGEVDEDVAADIAAELEVITAPPAPVVLNGLGRFGDKRGARILYVGVDPDPALTHLRDKVESACVRAGLEPERRAFKPHVTLARFARFGSRRVDDIVAANTEWRPGAFLADSFVLFSSHLSPHGADYTAERTYLLGG
jgi:2'-5' RNA ligase